MEPSIGAVNFPVQYFYPIGAIIFSYDGPLFPTSFNWLLNRDAYSEAAAI
jgi:hypothetical protein